MFLHCRTSKAQSKKAKEMIRESSNRERRFWEFTIQDQTLIPHKLIRACSIIDIQLDLILGTRLIFTAKNDFLEFNTAVQY